MGFLLVSYLNFCWRKCTNKTLPRQNCYKTLQQKRYKSHLKVRTSCASSKLRCATKKCSCASKKRWVWDKKFIKKSLDRVERKRGGPHSQPTVTNQLVTYYNEPKQNNTWTKIRLVPYRPYWSPINTPARTKNSVKKRRISAKKRRPLHNNTTNHLSIILFYPQDTLATKISYYTHDPRHDHLIPTQRTYEQPLTPLARAS